MAHPEYLPKRKFTQEQRQNAQIRAQAMFDRVARFHAEGNTFTTEKFKLLQILGTAMGVKRDCNRALLAQALVDPDAEKKLVKYLADLIILT